jgi:biotin carboxyl carrier protein
MPGLVIKVLVSPGDRVAAGDVVVVLEAMKMENEICSPKDGTVREVRVRAGESVQQSQALVVIE